MDETSNGRAMRFGAALAMSLITAAAAHGEVIAGRATVVDGDTLDIDGERIRLRSEAGPIDAPELRKAQCPLELFRAQAARERLAALMAPNDFSIDRRGRDRYGRTVAVVYSQGVDVASTLVREGHAKPWPKLARADRPTWC